MLRNLNEFVKRNSSSRIHWGHHHIGLPTVVRCGNNPSNIAATTEIPTQPPNGLDYRRLGRFQQMVDEGARADQSKYYLGGR